MRKGTRAFPKPQLESAMLQFFRELGIPASEWADTRLDIVKTPHRIAKMLRDEMLSSYKPGALQALINRFTLFPSDGKDAMVVVGPIDFHSMCAHHMLPFSGQAYVGYVPDRNVVGLSKIPRVVEHYSRMLQIQERMARQVVDFIHERAGARFTVCLVRAAHQCMQCRGVRQQNALMVTTAVRPEPGGAGDDLLRGVLDEFYAQIRLLP